MPQRFFIMDMIINNKIFIKLVAFLVIITFLCQNLAWANGSSLLAPDSELDDLSDTFGIQPGPKDSRWEEFNGRSSRRPNIRSERKRGDEGKTTFPAGIDEERLQSFRDEYGDFGVIEGWIGEEREFFYDLYQQRDAKERNRVIKNALDSGILFYQTSDYNQAEVVGMLESHGFNLGYIIDTLGLNGRQFRFFTDLGLRERIKQEIQKIIKEENYSMDGIENRLGLKREFIFKRLYKWLDIVYDSNDIADICDSYNWNLRSAIEHLGIRYPVIFFNSIGLRDRVRKEVFRIFREEENVIASVIRRIGMSKRWCYKSGFKWLDIETDKDMNIDELKNIIVNECKWVIPQVRKKVIISDDIISLARRVGLDSSLKALMTERLNKHGIKKTAQMFGVTDPTLRLWMKELGVETERHMADDKVLRILGKHKWNLAEAKQELMLPADDYWDFFVRHDLLGELEKELRKRLGKTNWNIVNVAKSFGLAQHPIIRKWMANLEINELSRAAVLTILEDGNWEIGKLKRKLRIGKNEGYWNFIVRYKLKSKLKAILLQRLRANNGNIISTANDFKVNPSVINNWIRNCGVAANTGQLTSADAVIKILEENDWKIMKVMKLLKVPYHREFEYFMKWEKLKRALETKINEVLDRVETKSKAADELGCTVQFINRCLEEFSKKDLSRDDILEILKKHRWNLKNAKDELGIGYHNYWGFIERHNLKDEFKRALVGKLKDSVKGDKFDIKRVAEFMGVSYFTTKYWMDRLGITENTINSMESELFDALLSEGEVERLAKLFGAEGAFKILARAYDFTPSFITSKILEYTREKRLRKKQGKGKDFTPSRARSSRAIKMLKAEDVDVIADELIASIYSKLVKNYRFLEIIEKEASNDENGPLLREAYRRAYEHYITVKGFSVKGIKNRKFFLKFFQKIGAKFILDRKNVIIADETGLGKTVQVIAAAQNANDGKGADKILVIAPKTALGHWKKEIEDRTIDNEKAFVVTSDNLDSVDGIRRVNNSRYVLVNYEIFRDNRNGTRRTLETLGFDFVVLDEAHRIRNETDITNKVREFDEKCETIKYKVALTATPLVGQELKRFYNILNWLDAKCYPLKRKAYFVKYYMASPERLNGLRTDVKNIMLRRHKSDVWCDLPKKHFIRVPVRIEPGSLQDKIYTEQRKKLARSTGETGISWSRKQIERFFRGVGGGSLRRAAIDGGLLRRKVVYEFDGERYVYPMVTGEIELLGEKYKQVWTNGNKMYLENSRGVREELSFGDIVTKRVIEIGGRICKVSVIKTETISAKYDKLDDLIKDIIDRGEKVIIYTNYRQVVEDLKERYRTHGVNILRSRMGYSARMEEINSFQSNPEQKIFISTYGTGGESITLTAANNIVLVDQPNTPQERTQAIGRLDRIGQQKDINIYSLIAEETADIAQERMLEDSELVSKLAFDKCNDIQGLNYDTLRQVLEGRYSRSARDRLSDIFKSAASRGEKLEKPYCTEEADGLKIVFLNDNLRASLRNKGGNIVQINEIRELLEIYPELDIKSKKLIKGFFIARVNYEARQNINIKDSIIWHFFTIIIPELGLLDYHGDYEEKLELSRYIIYKILESKEEIDINDLISEIGDERLINEILYFLDVNNVFKIMSYLGILSNNYYFESGLLIYDRNTEVIPFNGKICYIDKRIIDAILISDIETGEVMPDDGDINYFEFIAKRGYRKLTKDEKARLEKEVVRGNLCAKEILAKVNLRVVSKIVGRVLNAWVFRNHAIGHYAREIDVDDIYSYAEEILNEELNKYMENGENGFEEIFVPKLIKRINIYIKERITSIKMERRTSNEKAYRNSANTRIDLVADQRDREIDREQLIDISKKRDNSIIMLLYRNGFTKSEIEMLFELKKGVPIKKLIWQYNKSEAEITEVMNRANQIIRTAYIINEEDRSEESDATDGMLLRVQEMLLSNNFTHREIAVFLRQLEGFTVRDLAEEFNIPKRMVLEIISKSMSMLSKSERN